ncbi:MAG TPA: hypothetical protein PKY83_05545 [Bacteroidales bacterium]|nr:MAG: hypothetical protein BWX52_01590 [Bacteroidetes bacterium ADurb.Bin013]HNR28284.1 hypothetical protein [Bacteroidales bacterium]HNT48303.1 hypothetical protein [Bacteroidales bacterium]HNW22913.1 hypothetical protein [Bacteroidales bacterium]HNZ46961.1 hypothetical protein [Bacteroidales bacterium]
MNTFVSSLKIMGLGMLGIFVFMLLFGVVIYALHKIFPGTTAEK